MSTTPTPSAIFSEAFKHFQAGRVQKAKSACEQALARDDRHADSLHLLGILALQSNQFGAAEELIRKAVAINPRQHEYLSNLGNVMLARGKPAEAAGFFEQAIAIRPDFAGAKYNLGGVLNMLGRRGEALAMYEQVCRIQPRHVGAQYHRAILLQNFGRLRESADAFRSTVELDPQNAEAWNNLGSVLYAIDIAQLDDAIACCRRAVAINPQLGHAHYNLGTMLLKNAPEEAIEHFKIAISFQPNHTDALNNLGSAYAMKERFDEAIECFRKSIAAMPNNADAHGNLGNAYREKGNFDEAIVAFRRAVEIKPTLVDAYLGLAVSLIEKEQWDEAATAYGKAFALRPDCADTLNMVGNALREKRRHEDAEKILRQALKIRPGFNHALVNLGSILAHRGEYAQAADYYLQAIQTDPLDHAAYANLGNLFKAQGRLDETIRQYQKALEIKPEFAQAHANLGVVLLLNGDYSNGWREYEWRWKVKQTARLLPSFSQPWWDGGDLTGKTILLHAEQGFGDTLQFVRYATPIAEKGAKVIIECPKSVQRLLVNSPAIARHTIVTKSDLKPSFDVHCPMLSIPNALGTTLETIPGGVPYLRAVDADIARWREALQSDVGTFKVGLVWAGNKLHLNDHNRSISLSALAPLAQPGVTFYSLQKGESASMIRSAPQGLNLREPPTPLGDFADTAALMMNLDLVISVDTSVVHLAGAIGRPVWVMLPFDPDWRWLLARSDSPWYPTMRLFRQPSPGDWTHVIAAIAESLKQATAR